jgi:hypothetical protein
LAFMKTRMINLILGCALGAGLMASRGAFASGSDEMTKALVGSTVLELPATAAGLVAKASAATKQSVAAAVVKAALGVNPSAAVAVVAAVAHENPGTAPVVAVTAATLQHKRIDLIAKAAVHAAPSEAAKIVGALIKEFPQDYGIIAIAAAEGAPSAGGEILAVVGDYVPALQPAIKGGVAASFAANNGNVPVEAILAQSYNQALTSGAVARPALVSPTPTMPQASGVPSLSAPTQGPPYVPIVGPIINYGPNQITPQVPGGRTYSSP